MSPELVLTAGSPAAKKTCKRHAKRVIPYACEGCGNQGEWRGATLPLEIHHKNGDPTDWRPENLGFHCPNCHAQTPNWRGRKAAVRERSPIYLTTFALSTPH